MKSLEGHFLIAGQELTEPTFFQTVILLVQHDDSGAMGVIVNRPSETPLKKLWKQVEHGPCKFNGLLYRGGPCEGPLMALHDAPELADQTVLDGLYFTNGRDTIAELVAKPPQFLRIFAGYSGWAAGQLEGEMDEGSWRVSPAKRDQLTADDSQLWRKLTGDIIGAALIKAAHVKHVPKDLRLN